MNYIAEMRKHVGHDVVMTVGCGVLIENEKGEVLLQKRSDTGEWCVPGGALEPGETYIEAATREGTVKKPLKKTSDNKIEIGEAEKTTEVAVEAEKPKDNKAKAEKKASKVTKADVQTRPAELPTQGEVKRIIRAANSGYAKPIMEVIKKSNQITFENAIMILILS